MDPAALAATVSFLVAVIGVGGTIYAQHAANVRADRREDSRQSHEREIKKLELEDKRRDTIREKRLEAYVELASITDGVDPNQPAEFDDLMSAVSKIELVADSPDVVSSARDLMDSAFSARRRGTQVHKQGKPPAQDRQFLAIFSVTQGLRGAFIQAARDDLTR